jgi:outer membrane protein assembly factor BamB
MKIKKALMIGICLLTPLSCLMAQSAGTKLWEFTAAPIVFVDPITGEILQRPAYIFSSPALGSDRSIYFGSGNGKLYALSPSGSEKWSFQTGAEIQSSPAVASDGSICFGSGDGKLYVLNFDGTEKWELPTGNSILSSPALGADGTIYVGSRDNNVYAVNPDGSIKWTFTTGRYVDSSPVIGADGTVYIGSSDWNFYALHPDGSEKWRFTYGSGPAGGLGAGTAIGSDGTLYVATGDATMKLHAFRPDGIHLWSFSFGPAMALTYASAPAIGSDGTIYVAANDRKLCAVNPDGTKKWEAFTGAYSQSSPAVGVDGMIYLSGDLALFAFDRNGLKQWGFESGQSGAAGGITSTPNLTHGGILYFGSGSGTFYAIKASGPLSASAGFIFRRDSVQRARATGPRVRDRDLRSVETASAGRRLSVTVEPLWIPVTL